MSKRTQNLLRALLSVALLFFVLRQAGIRQAGEALLRANALLLLTAFALYQVGIVVRAFRWQTLLTALDMSVSLPRLVSLYYVGTFYSQVLPSGIGGDVVRMIELSTESQQTAKAVSSTVVDRLTGLIVLFLIALAALPFSFRLIPAELAWAIVVVTAGASVGSGLLLYRPVWRKLRDWLPITHWIADNARVRDLYETLHDYGPGVLLRACGASLLFNTILIAGVYLLALALDIHISPWYFLLFVPMTSFSLVLPISISGLGVREGVFVFLYTQAGVSPSHALALSFAFYALSLGTGLVGGVVHFAQGMWGLRPPRADTM